MNKSQSIYFNYLSQVHSSKVEVTWVNDENLSQVYAHDELMMVAGFADHFTAPITTGVIRKIGEALIDLPAEVKIFRGSGCFSGVIRRMGIRGISILGYVLFCFAER